MFTGIIESMGTVVNIVTEEKNIHFTIASTISAFLKIDQSIAHNGVCLTVVDQKEDQHTVTAIQETLVRSNLGVLRIGDHINLERAMLASQRLDGHIVQGHVDTIAQCVQIEEMSGSWYFTFEYDPKDAHLLVDKGSICINGVSLTLVSPTTSTFKVAIIPYTYEHTNFKQLKLADHVNIEFDILGKYIARYAALYAK